MPNFNVKFSGEIVPGQDLGEVKQKLGAMLKLPPDKVERLFSGTPVIIRKNVDEAVAVKLRNLFHNAGAVCDLEPLMDDDRPLEIDPVDARQEPEAPGETKAQEPPPHPPEPREEQDRGAPETETETDQDPMEQHDVPKTAAQPEEEGAGEDAGADGAGAGPGQEAAVTGPAHAQEAAVVQHGQSTPSGGRMLLTNVEFIPGATIVEHYGLVSGSTIRAKHIGRDLMASLKNIVGGELKGYTELLQESRRQATERMIAQAEELGANAIVNVRFSTSSVAQGAAELYAYGTAVRIREEIG